MINDSQRNKMHPHKFTLWVGLGSIIMMFAGLTSAYIVKREQPNWISVDMPMLFWYSTAVLLLSSLTASRALKAFKERSMLSYKRMLTITVALGAIFIAMQLIGFNQLWNNGLHFNGSGGVQFLYIIFGLHGLHVLGGMVALLVMFFRIFNSTSRSYNSIPLEVVCTYWHFVDILWIYLFVFFIAIK